MTIRMENGIRRARENEGLTQAALANLVGIDNTTLSKWEKGHPVPDRFKYRLAKHFEMPVHHLFFFDTVREYSA